MAKGSVRLHIRKDALKFSSAHMTVFADGTKESLHGHNYQVDLGVDVRDASLSSMVPFECFKNAMKAICAEWDEKVLLPSKCPFLKVASQSSHEIDFTLCGKRYVLPLDECVFLAVDTVTSETLASEFCQALLKQLPQEAMKCVLGLHLKIEESPGQGATFSWVLPS